MVDGAHDGHDDLCECAVVIPISLWLCQSIEQYTEQYHRECLVV